MKKKEVIVMNLKSGVEEMEGARRATGISSTAALPWSGTEECCSQSRGSGEGKAPELYGGV